MSVVGPRPMVPNTYANYPQVAQEKLNTVRPGLTGIGSIIFRDEERYLTNSENPMEFYKRTIIPFKSDLEIWFVENKSIWMYFKIIFLTAWVVISSQTRIVELLFKELPVKPEKLD